MRPPRKSTSHGTIFPASSFLALLLVLACTATLSAQQKKQPTPPGATSAPVVDSAADASPATPPPSAAPTTDAAAEASPVTPTPHAPALPSNVDITVHVLQAADSGHAKNGDMLRATLASPMRSGGKTIPAGTRVGLTVVTVSPAGKLQSRGELSLQVVSIGGVPTFSETITLHGQPGHKDLPDSAPAKGTEAVVAANSTLHFKIPPPPKQ